MSLKCIVRDWSSLIDERLLPALTKARGNGAEDSLVPQLKDGESRIWKDLVIVYYPFVELTSPGLRSPSWDSVA